MFVFNLFGAIYLFLFYFFFVSLLKKWVEKRVLHFEYDTIHKSNVTMCGISFTVAWPNNTADNTLTRKQAAYLILFYFWMPNAQCDVSQNEIRDSPIPFLRNIIQSICLFLFSLNFYACFVCILCAFEWWFCFATVVIAKWKKKINFDPVISFFLFECVYSTSIRQTFVFLSSNFHWERQK